MAVTRGTFIASLLAFFHTLRTICASLRAGSLTKGRLFFYAGQRQKTEVLDILFKKERALQAILRGHKIPLVSVKIYVSQLHYVTFDTGNKVGISKALCG